MLKPTKSYSWGLQNHKNWSNLKREVESSPPRFVQTWGEYNWASPLAKKQPTWQLKRRKIWPTEFLRHSQPAWNPIADYGWSLISAALECINQSHIMDKGESSSRRSTASLWAHHFWNHSADLLDAAKPGPGSAARLSEPAAWAIHGSIGCRKSNLTQLILGGSWKWGIPKSPGLFSIL